MANYSFDFVKAVFPFFEPSIVKLKILTKIFLNHHFIVGIDVNNSLSNKWIAKIIKRGRNFYKIELNASQITYSSKGNTRSALNSIFHYIRTQKLNSQLIFADLSDGGNDMPPSSNYNNFSFSSNSGKAILIPDHQFINEKGYVKLRRIVRNDETRWSNRKNIVLWRGNTSGHGEIEAEPLEFDNEKLIPRIRMCIKLIDHPFADVGIAVDKRFQQNHPSVYQKLSIANIGKSPIPQERWISYKFTIDIDGHTNAWKNFFCRMLMGCCIIKIASPKNYRQWYYHQLEPWTHYVPAKEDFSDIEEKIDWCLKHDAECEKIATNAKNLAFKIAEDVFKIK